MWFGLCLLNDFNLHQHDMFLIYIHNYVFDTVDISCIILHNSSVFAFACLSLRNRKCPGAIFFLFLFCFGSFRPLSGSLFPINIFTIVQQKHIFVKGTEPILHVLSFLGATWYTTHIRFIGYEFRFTPLLIIACWQTVIIQSFPLVLLFISQEQERVKC